jgi:hypothetical protein
MADNKKLPASPLDMFDESLSDIAEMIRETAAREHRVICRGCGRPYICTCDHPTPPECAQTCDDCGS